MEKRMKRVYLAAPYSNENMTVKIKRFEAVNKKAGELMAQGYVVFSPISMAHPIALAHDLPGHWDFWKKQDIPFIEWCDEMHVLCLCGWQMSRGVRFEIEHAQRLGMLIVYWNEV